MNPSIVVLQAQIQLSFARAAYWTAFAHTPANLAREVYHGGTVTTPRHRFTKDELIDDAMATASTHLIRAQEALDVLVETVAVQSQS